MRRRPGATAGRVSSREVAIVAALGLVLVSSAGGSRMFVELRRLKAEREALARQETAASQRLKALEQERAELAKLHEATSADRDNLFAQIQRAFKERDEALAKHQLLEQAFRQAEGERLSLIGKLPSLEERATALQTEQDQMARERQGLEKQLAKAKDRSQEDRLRTELSGLKKEQAAGRRALRDATRQQKLAVRKESQATKRLEELSSRLEKLQGEYADEVTENATLRRKMSRLPGNVTDMAREHARLVNDMADTHYNMGVMFSQKRDFTRAVSEFRQVVEMRPDDAEAHYNLGVIYAEHLPDREKAIQFFRKYLAIEPKGASAGWARQYIATWQAWEAKERLN